jgi:hypothetical protein
MLSAGFLVCKMINFKNIFEYINTAYDFVITKSPRRRQGYAGHGRKRQGSGSNPLICMNGFNFENL